MSDFDVVIREMLPELIAFRHEMHRNPELAYDETETAARIERVLIGIPGLEIRTGVAKTGIVATLNGDRDGRCVLLRGDMDALPIQEANTFDYRSRRDGVMHACGHDGHTTCLLGAARVLAMFADQLPGKVRGTRRSQGRLGVRVARLARGGAWFDRRGCGGHSGGGDGV